MNTFVKINEIVVALSLSLSVLSHPFSVSLNLSLSLSVSVYLYLSISICLSLSVSLYLSLSICLSHLFLSICLPLSVSLSIYMSLSLSFISFPIVVLCTHANTVCNPCLLRRVEEVASGGNGSERVAAREGLSNRRIEGPLRHFVFRRRMWLISRNI